MREVNQTAELARIPNCGSFCTPCLKNHSFSEPVSAVAENFQTCRKNMTQQMRICLQVTNLREAVENCQERNTPVI